MQVEGKILRILRERAGWSCKGLAKEVGLHHTHLLRVERGERELGKAAAQRIAGVLGLPTYTFYGRQDQVESVA